MFPHSITIYRYDEKLHSYSTTYVNCVYVQQGANKNAENNGVQANGELTITTSPETTKNYKLRWRAVPGDYIVIGRGGAIDRLKELNEYFSVTSVAENICGSAVDNVVIKAV